MADYATKLDHAYKSIEILNQERASLQAQLEAANTKINRLQIVRRSYKESAEYFELEAHAANKQLKASRAQCDSLLVSGQMMSNVCFNLSQWEDQLPAGQANVLKQLQKDWDEAVSPLRQQAKEEPSNNQCDGCQKGHQTLNGVHVNNDGYPYMACQENSDEQAAQADKGVGGEK